MPISWLCILIAILSMAAGTREAADSEWLEYKRKFGLLFSVEEDRSRREIFEENLKYIREHNAKETGFSLGVNDFTHLNHSEFVSMRLGQYMKPLKREGPAILHNASRRLDIPAAFDWRSRGAVTRVKSQKQCGACYAFGAIGSLEGAYYRKTKKLVSFSEQQIVDCDTLVNGCSGGHPKNVYKYIMANGIMSEKSYRYRGMKMTCRYDSQKVVTKLESFKYLANSEDALTVAVATIGPISVLANGSPAKFQFYHNGVYDDKFCSPEKIDHVVTVVGYGTDIVNGKKVDYFLIKNSWGTWWGMSGYMKYRRNTNRTCGIWNYATYPVI